MVRGTSFRGAPSRGAETAVGDTAEVVFLGELTGATGFGSSASGVGVSCKYVVVHGEHWHLARGDASGATQASHASEHGGELAAWGHPVQLSFNTTSVQGWPKLLFALYERDAWAGTDVIAGYGACALPLTPGTHDLRAHCFSARDRTRASRQDLEAFFGGAKPELENWRSALLRREELFASPAVTTGVGAVYLTIACVAARLDVSGVHVGGVAQAAAAERARRAALRKSVGGLSSDGGDTPSPRAWGTPEKAAEAPDSPDAAVRGLDSVRRLGGAAAGYGDDASSLDAFSSAAPAARSRRRGADAFGAAARLGRAGAALAPGSRRSRGAAAGGANAGAGSALLSERRAALGGFLAGPGPDPSATSGAAAPGSPAFAHQREAIEDAPLAAGREARRAAREAEGLGGAGGFGAPGGRRARRGGV